MNGLNLTKMIKNKIDIKFSEWAEESISIIKNNAIFFKGEISFINAYNNNSDIIYKNNLYAKIIEKRLEFYLKSNPNIDEKIYTYSSAYCDRPAIAVIVSAIIFYIYRKNNNSISFKDIYDIFGEPTDGINILPDRDTVMKNIWYSQKCGEDNMLDNQKIVSRFNPDSVNRNNDEHKYIINVIIDHVNHKHIYDDMVNNLIEHGCSKSEAIALMLSPVELELHYDKDNGVFAIESEAANCIDIYSPYTSKKLEEI